MADWNVELFFKVSLKRFLCLFVVVVVFGDSYLIACFLQRPYQKGLGGYTDVLFIIYEFLENKNNVI